MHDGEKYSQVVTLQKHFGFPHKSGWDEMIEYLAPRNQFTWFREITEDLDYGRVSVKGFGDMLMLGGYSYLGLNKHPLIRQAVNEAIDRFGTGTAGSRWLAGHTSLHEELENLLASFHGTEDAVVFSSGYVANVSTIAALVGRNDLVISDKLSHASIVDGCRFSGAGFQRFRCNDLDNLRYQLQKYGNKYKRRLVVVDGVYSMSGELLEAKEVIDICREYEAALMIDECHSHFVVGKKGGGIKEYFNLKPEDVMVEMGTLSKAIPSDGGYIAGSSDICNFVRREARGFIYSGSLSAVMVASAIAAIKIVQSKGTELIEKLEHNTKLFRNELLKYGIESPDSRSPIVPIHVGLETVAAATAATCHRRGIFIHPVFTPVVPVGKSILRASIMANHREEDLRHAAAVIAGAIEEVKQESEQSYAI